MKIASLELATLPIKKTKELLSYIVKEGYSIEYGARNIARFIKKNIAVRVADAILNKEIPLVGNLYTPSFRDSQLSIVETKTKGDNNGLECETERSASKTKRKVGRTTTTTRRKTTRTRRKKDEG